VCFLLPVGVMGFLVVVLGFFGGTARHVLFFCVAFFSR
jgi:hypothetical protein